LIRLSCSNRQYRASRTNGIHRGIESEHPAEQDGVRSCHRLIGRKGQRTAQYAISIASGEQQNPPPVYATGVVRFGVSCHAGSVSS